MAAGRTSVSWMARIRRWLGSAATEPGGAPTTTPPVTSPPVVFDYQDERIPIASRSRVADVLSSVARIEELVTRTRGTTEALEQARAIRERYLPDLLNSYFAIPPEHRNAFFRRTGRSASVQLNERIDVLLDELRSIAADLADGHIDQFARHLKFIDQRFDPVDPWR